jgi:hypothetical protein
VALSGGFAERGRAASASESERASEREESGDAAVRQQKDKALSLSFSSKALSQTDPLFGDYGLTPTHTYSSILEPRARLPLIQKGRGENT